MKYRWSLPPWARELSYSLLPSRRQVARQLVQLTEWSLSLPATHQFLFDEIVSGRPFYLGRPGGTESEGLRFFIRHRLGSLKENPRAYTRWFSRFVKIGPGVVHFSSTDLDNFCLHYLRATLESDMLAFGRHAPGALGITRHLAQSGTPIADFFHLEPLLALGQGIRPWTQALAGKRVLVVHPFEESVRSQYSRRGDITGVQDILPTFELETLRPPVTFAGERSDRPWRSHLDGLVNAVSSRSFDIAIIGAGSYGLPLAKEVRDSGRQAIHLGGSTQLLFGIRGRRWDAEESISRYFDATWIRPLASETPRDSGLVEGGIYW